MRPARAIATSFTGLRWSMFHSQSSPAGLWLRAGERIEGRDRETYDQGLIGILNDLHKQIDAEVAAAYGWPVNLSDVGSLYT